MGARDLLIHPCPDAESRGLVGRFKAWIPPCPSSAARAPPHTKGGIILRLHKFLSSIHFPAHFFPRLNPPLVSHRPVVLQFIYIFTSSFLIERLFITRFAHTPNDMPLGTLELRPTADLLHCHFRDGGMMEFIVPTIKQGGCDIVYVRWYVSGAQSIF